MPAPPSSEDFVSAALRHIRDAEHLAKPGSQLSLDQAWHLAGFAHECARKACLRQAWIPRLLGHDFSEASDLVVDIAISLDPHAARYPSRDWATRYPMVADWLPDHRYERTGAADARDVHGLVREGRSAVGACALSLFVEGTLSVESLR